MEITADNFDNCIQSSTAMLLDCYTDWCGPCTILKPIIEKIGKDNENIKVGFLNIENEYELGKELKISTVPTVLVVKNGKIFDRVIGVRSEEYYIELFKN